MGYVSILAIILLVAFMFYVVDAVAKMGADVKLIASYVKQQQQKRMVASKALTATAASNASDASNASNASNAVATAST